jgi:glutathione synthase/RimK-type ligase-like ATP-grasp enzyme
MVNAPEAESAANDKGLQLRVALGLGMRIPETLITNSPDQARAFCARFPEVVFKLINRPRIDYGDRAIWISTNLLGPDDIGALEQLQHCPGIFQRRIPKRFDLRITVVGNRVFPVEIHSQEDPKAAVDFRVALAEDTSALPHVVHDLPDRIQDLVLGLARRLGLVYCAIDMVVTPDGDYVFVEVNPSGQYGWIESRTSLPITEELIRMFMRGRP